MLRQKAWTLKHGPMHPSSLLYFQCLSSPLTLLPLVYSLFGEYVPSHTFVLRCMSYLQLKNSPSLLSPTSSFPSLFNRTLQQCHGKHLISEAWPESPGRTEEMWTRLWDIKYTLSVNSSTIKWSEIWLLEISSWLSGLLALWLLWASAFIYKTSMWWWQLLQEVLKTDWDNLWKEHLLWCLAHSELSQILPIMVFVCLFSFQDALYTLYT